MPAISWLIYLYCDYPFPTSLKSFCRFLFIYISLIFMSVCDGWWLWRLTVIALLIVESYTSEVVFFFFKGKKNCSLLLSTKTYSTNQESRLDKVLKLSVWPLLCFWVPPKVVSCLLYYCWCCYHNLTLGWLMKIFFNKKTISNKQVTSFVCMYGFLN